MAILIGLFVVPLYLVCGILLVAMSAMPGLSGFSYLAGPLTFIFAVILSPTLLIGYFRRRVRKPVEGFDRAKRA